MGRCVGTPECADEFDCTRDYCSPRDVCNNAIREHSCLIDGVCYGEGDLNPLNRCEWCARFFGPADDWTRRSDGSECGEGSICESGVCIEDA